MVVTSLGLLDMGLAGTNWEAHAFFCIFFVTGKGNEFRAGLPRHILKERKIPGYLGFFRAIFFPKKNSPFKIGGLKIFLGLKGAPGEKRASPLFFPIIGFQEGDIIRGLHFFLLLGFGITLNFDKGFRAGN